MVKIVNSILTSLLNDHFNTLSLLVPLEHWQRIKQEFAFSSATAMRRMRTRPRNIEICVGSGNTHVGKELDTISPSLVFVQSRISSYGIEICTQCEIIFETKSVFFLIVDNHLKSRPSVTATIWYECCQWYSLRHKSRVLFYAGRG